MIAAAARQIQVLEIHGCPELTTACSAAISDMTSIKSLTLPEQVTSEDVTDIVKKCSNITRLEPDCILKLTDFKSIIMAIGSGLQYFLAPYALHDNDILRNACILKRMSCLWYLCLCGMDVTSQRKQFLTRLLP